jgi:lipopolysaccharide transport system ATP-binding protein
VNEDGRDLALPLENCNKAYVQIELNVKKLHEAFVIGYNICSTEGEVLFWSYVTDDYKEEKKLVPGKNILRGEIPNHFLNEGEYIISLTASLHYIQWIINPDEDAPRLKLYIQGGLSQSPFWTLKRSGICAPVLSWIVNEK